MFYSVNKVTRGGKWPCYHSNIKPELYLRLWFRVRKGYWYSQSEKERSKPQFLPGTPAMFFVVKRKC